MNDSKDATGAIQANGFAVGPRPSRSKSGSAAEFRRTLWLLLAAACLHPTTASAYIDPNLGGLLFQWLAPLFALLVAFWSRLKFVARHLVDRLRRKLTRNP